MFRTVRDRTARTAAQDEYDYRDSNPYVIAWTDTLNEESKRKCTDPNSTKEKERKAEREAGRINALHAYELQMGCEPHVLDVDSGPTYCSIVDE